MAPPFGLFLLTVTLGTSASSTAASRSPLTSFCGNGCDANSPTTLNYPSMSSSTTLTRTPRASTFVLAVLRTTAFCCQQAGIGGSVVFSANGRKSTPCVATLIEHFRPAIPDPTDRPCQHSQAGVRGDRRAARRARRDQARSAWSVVRVDPGDLGGSLQLLAQPVVFQGEPLDVRNRQVEVFGKFVVVPPQLVVVGLELVEPADSGICRRWTGRPLVDEVGGEIGKVASERRVGQPEPAGQRQDCRGLPVSSVNSLMANWTSSTLGRAVWRVTRSRSPGRGGRGTG